MKTRFVKILTLSFILFVSSGCFFNTRENINKLQDKKFYFSEFDFILMGQDKEKAYDFFKKFPVKKIMFMIATEYNISIDISEYNNFIKTKNLSAIETDGAFRVAKHTWKKSSNDKNRIRIIFEQDYFEADKLKFSIGIYNENSTLKLYNTEIGKINHIIENLKYHLQSGQNSLKEYEDKNYDKVSPVPFIIEADFKQNIDNTSELDKIKQMIDNHIKTLDQDQKDKFKHDIIDYIYQKCN